MDRSIIVFSTYSPTNTPASNGSFGSRESALQTASGSVQPFLHNIRPLQSHIHTVHTHRDHATCVRHRYSSSQHLAVVPAMRPCNNKTNVGVYLMIADSAPARMAAEPLRSQVSPSVSAATVHIHHRRLFLLLAHNTDAYLAV